MNVTYDLAIVSHPDYPYAVVAFFDCDNGDVEVQTENMYRTKGEAVTALRAYRKSGEKSA